MSDGGSFNKRPSLVVGVGGTGLRIAKYIHQELGVRNIDGQMKIAVLAFDTDEDDIRRIDGSKESYPVIRISSQQMVYRILTEMADMEVSENWPPVEDIPWDLLVRKNIDGAGQVRMLSSMGMYYQQVIDNTFKDELNKVQKQLFAPEAHPDAPSYSGNLDVMVVGSLAGGTGSGIFLQTALLVRDWLQEIGAAATVRGLLLLPNVYIGNGLPAGQNDNVRINAYAALREINAVMQAVTGRGENHFNFHYAPDRTLTVWESNSEPSVSPFQSITLMDGQARAGATLEGGIEAYERMAASSAFQLMFTPLGTKHNSIADNQVRETLAQASENRTTAYAAMGMSGIVYPLKEIEEYLSLCFAQAVLSEDWLLLDRMYAQEYTQFQVRKMSGDPSARKAPDRGQLFLRSFASLAKDGHPLLRDLYGEVYFEKEDNFGNATEIVLHQEYLDKLETHMLDGFWEDKGVALLRQPGFHIVTLEDFDNKDLVSDIRSREQQISRISDALSKRLGEEPRTLFMSAWITGESTESVNLRNYHLRKHLFSDSAHPLKARYFLYALQQELAYRFEKAKKERGDNEKRIENLSRMFDDKETPHTIETAVDTAAGVMSSSWWNIRDKKKFKEQYASYFKNMVDALREKGNLHARIQTYELLTTQVNELTNLLEQFFTSLSDLQDELLARINSNQTLHNLGTPTSDTRIYVLGDSKSKTELWSTLAPKLSGQSVGTEVNRALLDGVYSAYKEQSKPRHSRFDEKKASFSPRELFEKYVVKGYCQDTLRGRFADEFQFNVGKAIQYDAVLREQQQDRHLKNLTESVYRQAYPFLDTDSRASNDIQLWTMNSSVFSALGGAAGVSANVVQGHGSASHVIEDAFDDLQLNCFHFRLNLGVEDLVKFRANGEYESAYRKVHDKLLKEEFDNAGEKRTSVFTHHVHKDWHRPGVLPEFSFQDNVSLEKRALSAYVKAYALDMFRLKDGAVYFGRRMVSETSSPDMLLRNLVKMPALVESVEQRWSEQQEDENALKVLKTGLTENALLFKILDFGLYRESQRILSTALNSYFELLRDVNQRLTPRLDEGARLDEFCVLLEQSQAALKVDPSFTSVDQDDRVQLLDELAQAVSAFVKPWKKQILELRQQGWR